MMENAERGSRDRRGEQNKAEASELSRRKAFQEIARTHNNGYCSAMLGITGNIIGGVPWMDDQ